MHNAPWLSHCLYVCVSVCMHAWLCVCVQPVMNLNYVLVWPSGPGYTSRVWDYAQWRNQGVCLLEWTLTLLIPRLRPQRWDISFSYLCLPVCPLCLYTFNHMNIQSLFSICKFSCTPEKMHFSLAGGSSDERKPGGVMVEFDDGDRGKISLPNIRLLPPGYQIHCGCLLPV